MGPVVSRESEYKEVALDFVKAARYPQSVFEFAADMETVGMRGGKIPAARSQTWKAVINQLITEGKLQETERGVHGPIEVEKPKQLTLF